MLVLLIYSFGLNILDGLARRAAFHYAIRGERWKWWVAFGVALLFCIFYLFFFASLLTGGTRW